ncbi:nitrate assimilation regulatory nirA [Fusarium albosuccineum]|uniref:Nitrate assimilation regulatory nirA n=1 Tax=Fusarium albosuccineum TaxID=1237068 RepID=A0A8H4LJD0_9HYPO|nr:nitrate assimilation regulatory nirA [Fusarium albosuccineum]
MPRPKVPAHQRQRASEACNLCRETKKRCSGSTPCTQCLRRGLEHQCFITYAPRGSRTRARAEASARAAASDMTWTQDAPALTSPTRAASNQTGQRAQPDVANDFQPLSPSDSRQEDDEGASMSERTDASSATNPPRMLLNSRGERVYIGGAASISFLQIVRDLVAQQIGPSAFSHNEKSDTMLEIESPQVNAPEPEANSMELDEEQRYKYLRCYYAVTEALIHVFDTSELETFILSSDKSASQELPPLKQASIDLVIAIGAQCQSVTSAKTIGQAYFREARRRAFVGFLEDPDLDMVRTFLLMAFYMLGECRRNAAFMYLGIAVKAALALGLHSRDSYAKQPGPADQLRLRVWMSICIVDKLVNSILGRPAATARIRSDGSNSLNDVAQPGDHIIDCLIAANKIVSIINDITDTLYDQKKITTPIVEQLLQDIERWKRELPESVRNPICTEQASPGSLPLQHGAIARAHVSCFYYLAVMLVSRPFLISSLTSQPTNGALHSQLSAACLDAAMYLSQTCLEALNTGLLQGNMAIMKALIFAAGLVLGFEMFAKHPVDSDIEMAFQGAKDVLTHLSKQSPQAAHYLEILASLSSAIAKRRSKESSAGRSRYVSKILSLDSSAPGGPGDEVQWLPISLNDNQLMPAVDGEAAQDWAFPQLEGGDLCLDWESLNISQWDSFPFLS